MGVNERVTGRLLRISSAWVLVSAPGSWTALLAIGKCVFLEKESIAVVVSNLLQVVLERSSVLVCS